MPKDLAAKIAQTAHALRRNLAEASDHAAELPDYLDPLIREMRDGLEELQQRRDELKRRGKAFPSVLKAAPTDGFQKREAIIETLTVLQRPAAPTVVARAAQLMFGADLRPSQFASIRKGDERAYVRGRQSRVILLPALSATDLTPRPRSITLSSWELEKRIIGQLSERVDALHIILRLVELSKQQPDRDWWSVLRPVAKDFGLSAISFDNSKPLVAEAYRALEGIEQRDLKERHEAAARAAQQPELRRMFGSFSGIETSGILV